MHKKHQENHTHAEINMQPCNAQHKTDTYCTSSTLFVHTRTPHDTHQMRVEGDVWEEDGE